MKALKKGTCAGIGESKYNANTVEKVLFSAGISSFFSISKPIQHSSVTYKY